MAYVSSRTTGCDRITAAEGRTCLLVSRYAAGKVDISAHNNSVHDNVAPNSTYTKSIQNEFVMFQAHK